MHLDRAGHRACELDQWSQSPIRQVCHESHRGLFTRWQSSRSHPSCWPKGRELIGSCPGDGSPASRQGARSECLFGFRPPDPDAAWQAKQCDDPRQIRKARGPAAPGLAVVDGDLGFRAASRDVHPDTREQRCRVHKAANVTGAMPKPLHDRARSDLQDIRMAATGTEAEAAFNPFVETHASNTRMPSTRWSRTGISSCPSGRTPEAHPHHQPGRERLLDGQEPHQEDQGLPEPENRPLDGLQADEASHEDMRRISGPNRLPEIIGGIEFRDGITQMQVPLLASARVNPLERNAEHFVPRENRDDP